MTLHDWQESIAGNWKGTNLLRLSWENPSEFNSEGTMTSALKSGGSAVELSYTWGYKGTPHEGTLMIAMDKKGNVTAGWVDSWHQSGAVLFLEGTMNDKGVLDLKGSYPAPTGPDWGWQIVISPPEEGTLRMTMFNIPPESQPDLAVRAEYTRRP